VRGTGRPALELGSLPGVLVAEDLGGVLDPALEQVASTQLSAIKAEAERAFAGTETRVS